MSLFGETVQRQMRLSPVRLVRLSEERLLVRLSDDRLLVRLSDERLFVRLSEALLLMRLSDASETSGASGPITSDDSTCVWPNFFRRYHVRLTPFLQTIPPQLFFFVFSSVAWLP